MKTIELDGVIKRLDDREAEIFVNLKGWNYVPKNKFKGPKINKDAENTDTIKPKRKKG